MKPACMADRHEVRAQSYDQMLHEVALFDILHCMVDVDESDGEDPLRMLTWSCKGVEHLSEPSQLSCLQAWDHGSTENQVQGL